MSPYSTHTHPASELLHLHASPELLRPTWVARLSVWSYQKLRSSHVDHQKHMRRYTRRLALFPSLLPARLSFSSQMGRSDHISFLLAQSQSHVCFIISTIKRSVSLHLDTCGHVSKRLRQTSPRWGGVSIRATAPLQGSKRTDESLRCLSSESARHLFLTVGKKIRGALCRF